MEEQDRIQLRQREHAIDQHIGNRLRLCRKMLGISQSQLAEKMAVSFQQVQKYERATNRIGAGKLFLLMESLHIPLSYFYEGLAGFPAEKTAFTTMDDPKIIRSLQRIQDSPHYALICQMIREAERSLP